MHKLHTFILLLMWIHWINHKNHEHMKTTCCLILKIWISQLHQHISQCVSLSPWLSSSRLSSLSWGARADLFFSLFYFPFPGWRWPCLRLRSTPSLSGGGLLCLWTSWWRRAGAEATFPIICWSRVHITHDLWNHLIILFSYCQCGIRV